jgi:hypothetical protein
LMHRYDRRESGIDANEASAVRQRSTQQWCSIIKGTTMLRRWEKQIQSIVKHNRHKLQGRSTSDGSFWERWRERFANSETALMNGG